MEELHARSTVSAEYKNCYRPEMGRRLACFPQIAIRCRAPPPYPNKDGELFTVRLP